MDKNEIQDRYFYVVGCIVHDAASADSIMCWTLEQLIGLRKEVAEAIFYAFDSFPGRKNLIERTLVAVKADQDIKDLVTTIVHNVGKVNKKRSELAHATFGHTSEYPAGAVQFRAKLQGQQFNPVTDAYLHKINVDVGQAHREAWKAYEALIQKLPKPRR